MKGLIVGRLNDEPIKLGDQIYEKGLLKITKVTEAIDYGINVKTTTFQLTLIEKGVK